MQVEVDVVFRGDAGNAFCGQVTKDRVGIVDMGKGTVPTSVDTVERSVSWDSMVEDDSLEADRVVRVEEGPILS